MKLSALGEDAVVRELTRGLPQGADVIVGAGDDCAVLGRKKDAWWRLAKTDAVIVSVKSANSILACVIEESDCGVKRC